MLDTIKKFRLQVSPKTSVIESVLFLSVFLLIYQNFYWPITISNDLSLFLLIYQNFFCLSVFTLIYQYFYWHITFSMIYHYFYDLSLFLLVYYYFYYCFYWFMFQSMFLSILWRPEDKRGNETLNMTLVRFHL